MHQPMTGEPYTEAAQATDQVGLRKTARANFISGMLTGIKVIAGLAFLYIAVRGVNWEILVSGLSTLNPAWLISAIISVLLSLSVKLWRYAILARNYRLKASKTRLFSSYFIGQAANIMLPMRGGDIIRIGYMSEDVGVVPQVTTTVVLEKYLDLIALVICAAVVSIDLAARNVANLRGIYLAIVAGASILLIAFALYSNRLWEAIRSKISLRANIIEWIDRWVEASQWLRNPRKIYPAILSTAGLWVIMWLTNVLVMQSVGIPTQIAAAGLVLVSVYIGLIPALMPGNIGPFYFFAYAAVIPFGVNRDQAILFAVVLHAIVTVPPLLCGVVGLFLRTKRVADK